MYGGRVEGSSLAFMRMAYSHWGGPDLKTIAAQIRSRSGVTEEDVG